MNDYESNQNSEAVSEREGHRDRIRLRMLSEGLDALPPEQLMEFLLYYVLPRQDVHDVAMAVMEQFGDIRRVFESSLEDFRQVKVLSECGAQWLDMIARLTRQFGNLTPLSAITVDNRRELLDLACCLRPMFPVPFCMQVLTDANGLLVMRRPLAHSLEWARLDVLRLALKEASCAAARNAYMIVFTEDHTRHPSDYDLQNIRKYAVLLKHSNCTLRDVMFVSRSGHTSMYDLNLIPDVARITRSRRQLSEDALEDLPERKLKILNLSQHDPAEEL